MTRHEDHDYHVTYFVHYVIIPALPQPTIELPNPQLPYYEGHPNEGLGRLMWLPSYLFRGSRPLSELSFGRWGFEPVSRGFVSYWGTWWCRWLRHCATSQKVAGSIPDGVAGIFQCLNTSGRTIALGSTQPITEMSTRNLSWGGKSGRCVWLTTLPPSRADCLEILGDPTSWSPEGPPKVCNGVALPFCRSVLQRCKLKTKLLI